MAGFKWAVGFIVLGMMGFITAGSTSGTFPVVDPNLKTFPPVYDLRDEGYPFPAMDQDVCHMGYALAGTEQFQAAIWKRDKRTVLFSVNQAKECNWWELNKESNPCEWGEMIDLVNLFSTQGVSAESCNPLFIGDGVCKQDCPALYHLSGWQRLSTAQIAPEETIKQAVLNYGPVYTKLNTALSGYFLYRGSQVLYDSASFPTVNHAVLIVGWDDTRQHAGGSGAWIIKNSHGTGWGDGGYGYVAYGSGGIGKESSVITAWAENDAHENLYYYDAAGFTHQTVPPGNNRDGYMMALFTPQRNEVIKQIELWTNDAAVVSVSVYDRFSNGELKDLIFTLADVSLPAAGYHIIPVPTPVEWAASDEIAVTAFIRNQTNSFPLALDRYSPMIVGKNWYSKDGIVWQPFEEDGLSGNVGLRLRTTLPLPPLQPSGFMVSSVSQTALQLSWQQVSPPIRSYLIERRQPDMFVWERIKDLQPDVTSFLDTELTADTQYRYRLYAYNLGGRSPPAEITIQTLPNPPLAPIEITPLILSPAAVRIAWQDQSTNETGFRVERQLAGGTWKTMTTVGANIQTWIDRTVISGLVYRYRVIAYNAGGDSATLVSDSVHIPDWPFRIGLPLVLR